MKKLLVVQAAALGYDFLQVNLTTDQSSYSSGKTPLPSVGEGTGEGDRIRRPASPSPHPSPIKGEGEWTNGSGRSQSQITNHLSSVLGSSFRPLEPLFPALTSTVQASFRTGLPPSGHGVVANGFFSRTLNRPFFWEQSARLVEGPRIWDSFRARGKRVAVLFWQQSLGESADMILSPAPIHKHHGGMIPDCYSQPEGLYDRLCRAAGGTFDLAQYWGPAASAHVGDWIVTATAALLTDREISPDLCLVYLPTLDYDLQRHGPGSLRALKARSEIVDQLGLLIRNARSADYDVLVFGDYAIGPVRQPVFPNRALAQDGLFARRRVRSMLYPDFNASRAFAMVDHEIAHVFVRRSADVRQVRETMTRLLDVQSVLDREQQKDLGLDHANSGELVAVAREGSWFAYPWWHDPSEAPDFATHVDIHNKPGYDPCELFTATLPWKISQDARRIKGSHGRVGPGRAAAWACTCDLGQPRTLLELAGSVKDLLETSS